ncbi:MAG: hypothetical protein Q8N44_14505, partial [Rubrivivax sp.]|nr:hypothetical protein [Rubrivivax sp.]
MTRVAALDDPRRPRQADADLLSLALIDARNLTLAWLAAFEAAPAPAPGGRSPLWLAGHAGWYQEYWIARHVQRQRGPRCDASALRLASIEPAADDAFGPGGHGQALGYGVLRHYLAATLDLTLDLLASAAADDDALHFYRLALLHEDRLGEALAETAALWQLAAGGTNPAPWRPLAPRPARDPLWLPAQRITLGSAAGGLVPDNETGSLAVDLPEFEIDA